MTAPFQHVRRYLCNLSELRMGSRTADSETGNHIDWSTWNAIRPDETEKESPIEPLMDLLSGTNP
jgi:hypothetical protein